MHKQTVFQALFTIGFWLFACSVSAENETILKSNQDKMSYALGADVGKNIRKQELQVNVDLMVRGLKEALAGQKLLISGKELHHIMNGVMAEVRQKMAALQAHEAEENRTKGDAFLAENKKKPGVVTLPSGVQYKIIKAGNGKKPSIDDAVECNYRGTLLDGSEFDATEPGKPATLQVAQLIKGWKEALMSMPEGSKWEIYIPSQSAYGARGVGNDIGPNATLVFEVDLLAVKPGQKQNNVPNPVAP